MNTQTGDTHRNSLKLRILACCCLLGLLLTACYASAAPSPAHESPPMPASQSSTKSHPPVILRVVDRQQVSDGFLWVYQDIYFMDPDGDAVAVTHAMVSSSLSYPMILSDDPIAATATEQKVEALFTVSGKCFQKMELAFASRIQDRAGNLSEPVLYSLSCTAPQPLDTTPLLVAGLLAALPIALILLAAYWILFRQRPADRLPALRSTLLVFFLLMVLRFLQLVFHEGGHALVLLAGGIPITFYVHPFFFSGFSRPFIDSSLYHILGSVIALSAAVLVFFVFWKRRSTALLALVMLFPYIALMDGINLMGIMGDFRNLIQSSGLPAGLFLIAGALVACLGLISLLSLLPLAGLDPGDPKALFVLPAAFFLVSAVSFPVAHLFVRGSAIDLEYFLAGEIISGANSFILLVIFGVVLALLYVTLYRKLYPRLPAWLRNPTANLTWKDLLVPAVLWAACVVIGLAIVI